MAEQMGLQGMHIPEEFGGHGFSYVELGIVLEEMGRALLCAPFFSTVVLAANALLLCGDETAQRDYLPGIASGETIATLAFTEPSGRWDASGIEMTATASGRRSHADRHEDVRDRRPHRRSRAGRSLAPMPASACSPSRVTPPG